MDKLLKRSLMQQHRSAQSVLAYRRVKRQADATALAELIYDVFKEKKQRENGKIIMEQNNAQSISTD